MGVLKIFDGFPGDFDVFSGDICCVFWRYLIGVLEIFCRCREHIGQVSWRYLIIVLEISDGCPEDI